MYPLIEPALMIHNLFKIFFSGDTASFFKIFLSFMVELVVKDREIVPKDPSPDWS